MGLEAAWYNALTTSAALAGLVSTRIYPLQMPQGETYPSVVYRRTGGERVHDFAGYSTIENAMFELVVLATAVTARRLTADAAIGALSSATAFTASVILSPDDSYDDEVSVYVRSYDISIWYNG